MTAEVASPFSAIEIKKQAVALEFFTHACPSIGLGRFSGICAFSHGLPDKLLSLPAEIQSAAHCELYPFVGACVLTGKLQCMTNTLFCLNEAAINKGHFSVPFLGFFFLTLSFFLQCIYPVVIAKWACIDLFIGTVFDVFSREMSYCVCDGGGNSLIARSNRLSCNNI